MKCDKCLKEATVHEVTIKNGKPLEKHLCEKCAADEGFVPSQSQPALTSLLTQFITQQTAGGAKAAAPTTQSTSVPTCPDCGTTYNHFRQNGLLGCPTCYEMFEAQLGPLLARAHEGGTHHVGKSPKCIQTPSRALAAQTPGKVALAANIPDPKALLAQIATLKRKLAEAVLAEQYEKAAKIRDQIAQIERSVSQPAAPTQVSVAPPAPPPKRARKRDAGPRGESPGDEGARP